MKEGYFKSVAMIERLHRLFLEVVKVELERMEIRDINNIQCLILYNIGREQVTLGELTNRGYYLGSNVSYSLSSMVKYKYLIREPSSLDRRTSYIRLSKKGLELYGKLGELFTMHTKMLEYKGINTTKLEKLNAIFTRLERFWRSLLIRRSGHDS
jgi:DNA-binding MarR family transcriptional regulator